MLVRAAAQRPWLLQTIQRSLCFPPARAPFPRVDKFIGICLRSQTSLRAASPTSLYKATYTFLCPPCTISEALDSTRAHPITGALSVRPQVWAKNPQSCVRKWNHLHRAHLGLGIDISTCFQEQLHTVAVTPLSSQVQRCKSFLDKAKTGGKE